MFGRDPIEDLDALFPSPARRRELQSMSEYMQKLTTRIEQANHFARLNIGLAVQRQRQYYQQQPKSFDTSDMVWLFPPPLGARGTLKMHSNWSGPWKVVRKINDLIFEILATEETGYRGKLVVPLTG